MVGIVIASHGELAPGIKQAGSMVFGDQPNVGAVSLMPSMGPDDIRAKIEECISSFDDQDQVLILADLWGGTPFNQASAVLDGHEDSWAIVTGLNLPMLIEAYASRMSCESAHEVAVAVLRLPERAFASNPRSSSPQRRSPLQPPSPPRVQFPRAPFLVMVTSSTCSAASTRVCSMVRLQPRGPR